MRGKCNACKQRAQRAEQSRYLAAGTTMAAKQVIVYVPRHTERRACLGLCARPKGPLEPPLVPLVRLVRCAEREKRLSVGVCVRCVRVCR